MLSLCIAPIRVLSSQEIAKLCRLELRREFEKSPCLNRARLWTLRQMTHLHASHALLEGRKNSNRIPRKETAAIS